MTITHDSRATSTSDPTIRPAPRPDKGDPLRYTSSEFLDLEYEKLWSHVWQLACLTAEVAEVGDHVVYEIGRKSVLVVREGPDSLRAYHNVCQHRARKLKLGPGHGHALRCPYHGWTWNLDGTLREIPERETFCELRDEDHRLREVRLETWGPWVFVNLSPAAPPLAEALADVIPVLEPYRLHRQHKWSSRTVRVRTNWKNSLDAFMEAYHGRSLHPETASFINYKGYPIDILGDHSALIVPFGVPDELSGTGVDWDEVLDSMEHSLGSFGEDQFLPMIDQLRSLEPAAGVTLDQVLLPRLREQFTAAGMDMSGLTDNELLDDRQLLLFPNVGLNLYGFGYWLYRIMPDPTDPDWCHWDLWFFHRVPDGAEIPPPVPNRMVEPGERCGSVLDQDFENLPHQQDGMKTGECPGLTYSSLEARIVHFHDVLDRYIQA